MDVGPVTAPKTENSGGRENMVIVDQGEVGSKGEYHAEVQGSRFNVLANDVEENAVIWASGFDQDPIIETGETRAGKGNSLCMERNNRQSSQGKSKDLKGTEIRTNKHQ